MMEIFYALIGIVLLTLGRRLFWLFVVCVGFVVGLQMAQQAFGLHTGWLAWAVASLFGLIGALLALFFQTLAIVLSGFAAGSTIAAYLTVLMGIAGIPMISVIGGIIGAILLYALFDWALIGLSSLAGATLVVQSLNWNSQAGLVLYVILIAAGILLQAASLRRQPPETR
jgi:Domain of unknown function (DUF4203)